MAKRVNSGNYQPTDSQLQINPSLPCLVMILELNPVNFSPLPAWLDVRPHRQRALKCFCKVVTPEDVLLVGCGFPVLFTIGAQRPPRRTSSCAQVTLSHPGCRFGAVPVGCFHGNSPIPQAAVSHPVAFLWPLAGWGCPWKPYPPQRRLVLSLGDWDGEESLF